MSAIHTIVVAIEVASDGRNPQALVPSRIAAAGIRTDPARGQYEPPRCLYTSPVEYGQRHDSRPLPSLPQALDALCQAARSFQPNLAVAHNAAFLTRHVPGLFGRLVPADPRPACTEHLARTLWPAAPSFEAEHLCYWRELLEDDAHQHPDFPVVRNPLWNEAIRQEWDDAACCAMLFGEIRHTIEATGRDVTPDLLRDWTAAGPLQPQPRP